jgi:choline dehydrogenase
MDVSSSVRGVFQFMDFNHWAQLGNRGWSWDDVLPYFKKAEKLEGEAGEVHGKDGLLFTSPMDR